MPAAVTPPALPQARWRPELEKIVAKVTRTFSRSFAKIGCAGEVALHIADMPGGGVDYARCAINIKCVFAGCQQCPPVCTMAAQHSTSSTYKLLRCRIECTVS